MGNKNSEYWQERFLAVEKQGYRQGSEMVRYANKQYSLAQNQIDKEITYWYNKIAENNQICYADAKHLLNKNELQEFKWSVEEYLNKAKENNLNQKWVKELTNASGKVHITRLEAMQTAVRQAIEELGNNVERNVNEGLGGVYEEQIYRTAYEVQTGRGIVENFGKIDEKQIAEALKKPWTKDKKTFSDRIWSNKDRLVNSVDKIITNGLIRGDSIADMTSRLQKAMKSERYNAERIIRTETAAIATQAHLASFEETGVTMGQVCETLDGVTCEVCGSKDGSVVDLKKAQVGISIPPFHPNCRGCVLPYYDDEHFKEGQTRIARDEEGKNYSIEDMTYGEWKEKFVKAKMANNQTPDWSKTQPITHTKEEREEIEKYAKSKNLNIYNTSSFDGNTEILKEQINVISDTLRQYNINDKVTLSFSNKMLDGDFAETVNNTITFNTKALRSRKVTNEFLNADNYLAATDIKGIAIHEVGHLISKKYGEKGLEIAKKAYYNVYKEDISDFDILKYLYANVSKYSVAKSKEVYSKKINPKIYKEIIPEMLAKNETNPNDFTKEFTKALDNVLGLKGLRS